MFGTASQIIRLHFLPLPLWLLYISLVLRTLSRMKFGTCGFSCFPDTIQPYSLFSFGWNLLNASFYWKAETKLSHFGKFWWIWPKTVSTWKFVFIMFEFERVLVWWASLCPGLHRLLLSTISAWFSLSVDAAVLSQSYLLAAFLSQTSVVSEYPSSLCQ